MNQAILLLIFSVLQFMAVTSYSQSIMLSLNVDKAGVGEMLKGMDNESFSLLEEASFKQPQSKVIIGRVTDRNDEPLVGVTVQVMGATTGTFSDLNGNYRLEVPSDTQSLVFSFIGMRKQEVTIAGRSIINIMMEQEAIGMDEVVVIGYGTVRRSDLTGSTSSMKGDGIGDLPVTSMEQAMQGRMAGVQITSSSGEPGAGINVIVRGASSISGGNQPLYVIDGVPIFNNSGSLAGEFENNDGGMTQINMLSALNPNDIESIEVLKDASATAIYGSRGANGVIMITTKKGQVGKGRIDVGYMSSYALSPRLVPLVNAQDYATYVNEFSVNTGREPVFDGSYHGSASGDSIYFPQPAEMSSLVGEGTNWQKEVMQNARSHEVNLRFSGGDRNLRYNLSGGFLADQGLLKNTDFARANIRANLNAQLSERVSIDWNATGSNINSNRTGTNTARSLTGGPERNSVMMKIFMSSPVNKPEHNLFFDEVENSNAFYGMMNPLKDLYNEYFKKNTYMVVSNLDVNFKLLEHLNFTTRGGITRMNDAQDRYWNTNTSLGFRTNGKSLYNTALLTQLLNENFLSYNRSTKMHFINAIAGFSIEQKIGERLTYGFQDYSIPLENGLYNNAYAGSLDPALPSSYKSKAILLSYYARMTYNYAGRYLFTFTTRADGSSVFAANNKWAVFPSAGIGWNFNQEKFLANLKWLSTGKLRLSYGVSGNQAINPYNSLPSLAAYNFGFITGRVTGVVLNDPGNIDLKWETTSQLDFGFELGVLENRYRLTVDLYEKDTRDLLQVMPVLSQSGFSSMLTNFGSMQNRGIEVELSTMPVRQRNFTWQLDVNFARNIAEITDLGELNYIDFTSTITNYDDITHRLIMGGRLGDFFGLQTAGLLSAEDVANNYPTYRGAVREGDLKFADNNDDGLISMTDAVVLGNAFPDYTFGVSNTIDYKKLSLSFLIRGAIGQKVMNWHHFLTSYGKGDGGVPTQDYFNDRWSPDNLDAYYPRPSGFGLAVSDRLIEDGSFIRLQSLTLSYNLSGSLQWLTNARIYVTGYNLFVIHNYSGYDPEVSAYGQNLLRAGIDKGTYPRPRMISMGINLGL